MENRLTSAAYLKDLARRIRRYRIEYPLTQIELAEKAGISLRSLQNFEQGKDIRAEGLVKILMALDLAGNLQVLVPDLEDRPSAYFNRSQHKTRQRASHKRKEPPTTTFRWGDEA